VLTTSVDDHVINLSRAITAFVKGVCLFVWQRGPTADARVISLFHIHAWMLHIHNLLLSCNPSRPLHPACQQHRMINAPAHPALAVLRRAVLRRAEVCWCVLNPVLQVIFALPAVGATDFTMRIFNSDGSEPEMCGNGIRCLARFVADVDGQTSGKYKIHTLAGTH